MYRALIFDFDGLIVDTESPIFRSWQELYESYGGHLELAAWATRVVGTVSNELEHFDNLEAQLGYPVDRVTLSPKRRQRELELVSMQPPRPGVREYLQDARRLGLKTGVASSSPCKWVVGHLEHLGLLPYFDLVLARDDVGKVKPDPELFLTVLAGLHVSPEQAIAFEDSPTGVTAAKRAGMTCVAVPNNLTRLLPLEEADLCLESMADLPLEELIKGLETTRNGG
jgi:HAD superfamily hydrolase (TIGR01509 family)